MYRLIRFYNQNRKDIWKVIGIILIIVAILQILNYASKKKGKKEDNNIVNSTNQNTSNQYNNISLETEKSVLSGESINQDKKNSIKLIDTFFSYCNEKNIQKAYELLTDECKEEMYSSVNDFEEMYYEKVFGNQRKNVSLENWTSNTYKVKISEDYLSSGEYTNENNIQDYITIQDNKLNINNYVRRLYYDDITKKENNLSIKLIQEDVYMEYIIYTFEIKSSSEESILLDTLESLDSMYIEDNNGVKSSAYTNELSQRNLLLNQGDKKQVKIKYYKKFNTNTKIKKIVFSEVYFNYGQNSKNSTLVIDI